MSVSVSASLARRLTGVSTPSRISSAKRAMSVAIYMHDLRAGGVERQSLIIAQEFRRYGVDVTLVLHRLQGDLIDQVPAGLRIVELQGSRTGDGHSASGAFLAHGEAGHPAVECRHEQCGRTFSKSNQL